MLASAYLESTNLLEPNWLDDLWEDLELANVSGFYQVHKLLLAVGPRLALHTSVELKADCAYFFEAVRRVRAGRPETRPRKRPRTRP